MIKIAKRGLLKHILSRDHPAGVRLRHRERAQPANNGYGFTRLA